ncbi:MAG: YceI family protein [Alphaproteobacteria bacterium]|nr:YceI family protein [Alphaproteobacteria bacterium]
MDQSQNFNPVTKAFHWSMALVILFMLPLGFWMVSIPFSEFKLDLYFWHKSFGLLVLFLVGLRILWRVVKPIPPELETHAVWERFLSKTVRIVFYISMIGMPLSGWVMSSAGDFPNSFFGLFEMPALTAKDEQMFELSKQVHELFALALIVAIGLHIAGGLKHHLIDRDPTLKRMGASPAIAVVGLVLLAVPTYFAGMDLLEDFSKRGQVEVQGADGSVTSEPVETSEQAVTDNQDALAQEWIVDPHNSSIDFTFIQYGKEISGRFENWTADIYFDPQALEQSAVKVVIDIAGIDTGSADRNEQAKGQDWFAVEEYPQAVFESRSFSEIEPNRFAVDGTLTLRGVEKDVSFPFSLEIARDGDGSRSALMQAELDLKRLAFGVGQNQWESTDAIGNDVTVSINVHANEAFKR